MTWKKITKEDIDGLAGKPIRFNEKIILKIKDKHKVVNIRDYSYVMFTSRTWLHQHRYVTVKWRYGQRKIYESNLRDNYEVWVD